MPIGAAISAVGTIGSTAIQSGAAGAASKAASEANANTLAFEKQVYGQAGSNLQPTINQGQGAGTALAGLLGIGGNPTASEDAFKNYLGSTNYNFQLQQGENAVEYANAPAFQSGATAKALNNYAQGQAGNALSGYESLLSGQQGLGVNAALGLGQIGAGIGNTINSANQANAATQGSAAVYAGNAQSSGLGGLANLINQGATQSSYGGGGSAFSGLFGNSGAGAGVYGGGVPSDLSGLI